MQRSEFSTRYDYVINMLNLKAAAGSLDESDITAINQFLTSSESILDELAFSICNVALTNFGLPGWVLVLFGCCHACLSIRN